MEKENRNNIIGWAAVAAAAIFFMGCGGTATRPSTPPPATPKPSVKKPSAAQPKKATQRPYKIGRNWYQPIPSAHGFTQSGVASWYGKKFYGRKTSNGEIYNMYGMTAAHKTLPMDTWVRVKNLDNKRTIDVRINDRGPFVRGRIIDLSYTAAKKMGMVGPGTARVKIVALGAATPGGPSNQRPPAFVPVDYNKGNFTFQVGAFRERKNAERLRKALDRRYKNAHISRYDSPDGLFFRVRVGRITDLAQAEAYEKILIQDGFVQAFIVAE